MAGQAPISLLVSIEHLVCRHKGERKSKEKEKGSSLRLTYCQAPQNALVTSMEFRVRCQTRVARNHFQAR